MKEYFTETDYLCEKLKRAHNPREVNRLCKLIKCMKTAEFIKYRLNKNDTLEDIKRLCINGYFNTKYMIEKFGRDLDKAVGEKKEELKEFLKDLKEIYYDQENGTNN